MGGSASPFAGWGFNPEYKTSLCPDDNYKLDVNYCPEVPEIAGQIEKEVLKTVPFFNPGDSPMELLFVADDITAESFLLNNVNGTDFTNYYKHNQPAHGKVKVKDWLLAEAFPATTLPMGANDNGEFVTGNNYNMSEDFKTNVDLWPVLETIPGKSGDWRHSDYKDVPFQHTYKFYNEIKLLIEQL